MHINYTHMRAKRRKWDFWIPTKSCEIQDRKGRDSMETSSVSPILVLFVPFYQWFQSLIPPCRFTRKEMEGIEITHRPTNTFSDSAALIAVRFLPFCMDTATGCRHTRESDGTDSKLAEKGKMTESKWLVRFIFLESVAAVSGIVKEIPRHLHSLRRMKRDKG